MKSKNFNLPQQTAPAAPTASTNQEAPKPGFLGLERVIRRLVAEDGFSCPAEASTWIREYEAFFLRLAADPATALSPSRNVDRVWLRHQLDTENYANDCHRWAGGHIHRALGSSGEPLARVDHDPAPARPGPRGALEKEDLTSLLPVVRRSLAQKPVPAPWIEEGIDLLESDPESVLREYRRFLEMIIEGSGFSTPSKLVDEFWHQHILDSEEYCAFCQRVAGRYLHHRPHYEKPHRFHRPRFRKTKARYAAHFGSEPDPRIWNHLGESGGCSYEPEPKPLFEAESASSVTVVLCCGAVDGRHFNAWHYIFTAIGLSPASWKHFLKDVDGIPDMPIGQTWRLELTRNPSAYYSRICKGAFFAALAMLTAFAAIVILEEFFALIPAMISGYFSAKILARSYPDPEDVQRVIATHRPGFEKLGIGIRFLEDEEIVVNASIRRA